MKSSYKKMGCVLSALAMMGSLANAAGPVFNTDVEVKPGAPPPPVETAVGTPGDLPIIYDNGDGTSTVFTRNSAVEVELKEYQSGGVLLETNGNATLDPEAMVKSTIGYNIYTKFLVDNATGLPTAAPAQIVAGYLDGSTVVELGSVVDTTPVDPVDYRIDITTLTPTERSAMQTAEAITVDDPVLTGGHLQVGGNAQVDGVLTVGTSSLVIDGNNEVISSTSGDLTIGTAGSGAVAIANDLDVAGALTVDGVNVGNKLVALDGKVTAETTRATTAEGVLDGKITAETTRATTAEGVLDGKITAETTRATTAEGVLDGKITAETTRATTAEGILDGRITQEVTDRTALIRRDAPGMPIHIGAGSFVMDDTNPSLQGHIITTSDGTDLVLGGGSGGNVQVASNLSVAGNTALGGSLSVAGDASVAGTLSVGGIADVEGTLNSHAATLANHEGRISANTRAIASNRRMINENRAMILEDRANIAALDRKVKDNKEEANAGVAGAAALDAFVSPSAAGKTTVMAGVASYSGESAVGVTATHFLNVSPENHININAGVSVNTAEKVLGRIGASFEF